MQHSFAKYAKIKTDDKGTPLHWNRASVDGAPFRGHVPPVLKGEDDDKSIHRVKDAKWRTFDLTIPEEGAAYQEVVDKIVNGLYSLIYIKRFVKNELKHYVEWAEHYIEEVNPLIAEMRDLRQEAVIPNFEELLHGDDDSETFG